MTKGQYIRTKEIKDKNSKSRKGKGIGNCGKYERTEKVKEKQHNKMKGRPTSKKQKDVLTKLFLSSRNPMNNPESVKKLRISALKRIEKNYGIATPSYNLSACEYFKSFDEQNNTKGRYAVYGDGEYLIEDLGYFPDYINFDLKLIIEWDEEHHFDENGNLNLKDVQRQQEIQKHFPDFEFRRIREKDLNTLKTN